MLGQPSILYIEDNPPNVAVVERVTENLGYTLHVAINATEGLQMLYTLRPDLVLMDIGLPDIDGLTATRQIRADHIWKDLPVIAITASAMVGDREKCLEAGCSDYLAKPFQVKDLMNIFNKWLPLGG
jgi:CheY-like chemotaxis protein